MRAAPAVPPPSSDVLVVGAGPAGLCIAAALAAEGLQVAVLAADDPEAPWANTYGIWGEEVDTLGLAHLLGHRWSRTVSYFGPGEADPAGPGNGPVRHGRDYGLFDRQRLQAHWLEQVRRHGVRWHRGEAVHLAFEGGRGAQEPGGVSVVGTAAGERLRARLVLDASGHRSALVQRPDEGPVAGQAAYGVVGRFTAAPVEPGQFVLMDFRCDHLSPEQRRESPSFLYAMDLGEGRFFVEETSLALAPPLPFDTLRQRLELRLAHRGVAISAVEHEEFCLFPMNLPLPDPHQPLLAFGGAAAMVHPASGYLVGALLRRAPGLARAVAAACADPQASPAALAAAGWAALWPQELRRKHALYQFGLEKLMRFPEARLRAFFATFFGLPPQQWYGFLTNTLSLPQLLTAMLRLFAMAPWEVRLGLLGLQGREPALLGRLLRP
ncbi:lycopene beta cyclase [Cyanobium sp. NIES-981]|uniref:lycopene beta cyclase n=1 Tax=Cyanobium sp. NIES-981 TaxID=1851505 RepID=UPI0007DDA2C2|nr:lycopene cyclase family protein [Cyanobium sp. NIES-981]SBO42947.1 Lycopene beta cyclase [Cyanobium sp. NIES-981]